VLDRHLRYGDRSLHREHDMEWGKSRRLYHSIALVDTGHGLVMRLLEVQGEVQGEAQGVAQDVAQGEARVHLPVLVLVLHMGQYYIAGS